MLPGFSLTHNYASSFTMNISEETLKLEDNLKHNQQKLNWKVEKLSCQPDQSEYLPLFETHDQLQFTPTQPSLSVTVKVCNFGDVLKDRFADLYASSDSADVSIMCGSNREVLKAHRYVLSYGSTYFRDALEVASCTNPVFALTNISGDIMGQILEYMYLGQVTLKSESELKQFLRSAKYLQVFGIQNGQYLLTT